MPDQILSFRAFASFLILAVSWVGCVDSSTASDADTDAVDVHRSRDSAQPEDVSADVGGDASDATPALDSGDDVVSDIDAGPGIAHVRLGNVLSPIPGVGLPPAIDVCFRPASGTTIPFTGPLLELSGLTAGLAWNHVTRYFDVPAGRYDLLLVSGAATDCNTPIAPPMVSIDLGADGAFRAVMLYGILMGADAAVPTLAARATSFAEHDPATGATAPQPLLHLFDALPVPAHFDVGIVGDPSMPAATFLPVWGGVGFGEVGMPATGMTASFDALDYFEGSVLPTVDVGARPSGTTGAPSLTLHGLSIMDHTYTLSVLTLVMPTPPGTPVPGVLLCVDNAPPIGNLSVCAALPGM